MRRSLESKMSQLQQSLIKHKQEETEKKFAARYHKVSKTYHFAELQPCTWLHLFQCGSRNCDADSSTTIRQRVFAGSIF